MPEAKVSNDKVYPWHRPCPVCGTDQASTLFDNIMAPLDQLDMSYRVGQCPTCHFCYACDLPLPTTYDEYYRSLSKYDIVISEPAVSPVSQARIHKTLEICVPDLPKNALIADVGCGVGALLYGFKSSGFARLHGIDPAPAAGREAGRLFGLHNVHTGSLREAHEKLPLHETDLLCLTGVAEHLPHLAEDLGWLLEFLPPGAKVLIEVPALEYFLATSVEPFGEFSLEHIQYFNAAALTRLLGALGFSPTHLSICALDGCTDSLFGLFSRNTGATVQVPPSLQVLDDYLHYSEEKQNLALQKIFSTEDRFIIFGAGSHTARLLPQLEARGALPRIIAIVDNNPNLHGKQLGNFVIQPSTFLTLHPGTPVLVSSFNAQAAIARQLTGQHPTILLYDNQ